MAGEQAVAFTVEDFQDLVRLLEQRPEWRTELRRLLLPEALLELPTVVRQLAEEVRLLVEAQRRTYGEVAELRQVVAGLVEAQARTAGEVAELRQVVAGLAEAQARTEDQVRVLAEAQARIENHVADLRGDNLERRYREHAGGYFGTFLRRARVVGAEELDDLLDEGLATGSLDESTAQEVRRADLVLRGRRAGEDRETFLVVEVSVEVDPGDVERAARRASLLGRVRPALAVVAGPMLTSEAASLARSHQVWHVENGRVQPPHEL